MPTLADVIFKPIGWGVKGAARTVTGGVSRQIGMGVALGAGMGAFGHENSDDRFKGMFKGAILGGIGGGAFSGVTKKVLPAIPGAAWGAGKWMWKTRGMPIVRGAMSAGRAGMKTAGFAATHWRKMAIVGGVAYGTWGAGQLAMEGKIQDMRSPTFSGAEVSTNWDQMSIAAEMGQIGTGSYGSGPEMADKFQYASWMDNVGKMAQDTASRRLAVSTGGLVQGMHHGRHG